MATGADSDLMWKAEHELRELATSTTLVQLMIRPAEAWVLLSFLQLALRHPDAASTPSAQLARRMARSLQKLVAPPGSVMEEIAERGWRVE